MPTSPLGSPETLRIAFCQPALGPLRLAMGGASTEAAYIQQAYIANGLEARGHRLTYIAPRGLTDVERSVDRQEPTVVPCTWSARRWFDLLSRGAWRAQQGLGVPYLNVFSNWRRFDACLRCLPDHQLVHERNGLYNAGVAMACRRLGLPFVMFVDADQIAELDYQGIPITGLLRWRAQQLFRYNLQTARCVLCVSEAAKAHLMDAWRVPASRIVVFPNAVDTERFRPSNERRTQVRASLGLEENPVVIFVGNFYVWHDIATLLDAFALVVRQCADARLLLVGDGPTREAMAQRAADLGLAGAVRLVGPVRHGAVPGLVAAADVAVVPVPEMERDSWLSPMKLFEYLACGAATVATRSGQVGTLLDDGDDAMLVPPADPAALATALSKLLRDPGLRERLGVRGRAKAVARHSWDSYVSRLERVYAAVIAGGSLEGL